MNLPNKLSISSVVVILVLLHCSSSRSFGQQALGKYTLPKIPNIKGLSFNLNLAMPMGDFASTDKASDRSGYAGEGFGFDVNYLSTGTNRETGKNDSFAFIATARYMTFSYDIDAVAANYKSDAPPGPSLWYGTAENWKMWSIMIGGNVGSIQTKDFSVGFRFQVGWLILMSKDRYINGIQSNGLYFYRITYQNDAAGAFSYLLGMNARWKMSPRASFITGIDYMGASPDVEYVATVASAQVVTSTTKATFTQPVNMLNLSAGFVFIF